MRASVSSISSNLTSRARSDSAPSRRRAASTKTAVMDAVTTVRNPIPLIMTTVAIRRPQTVVGVMSP